jgi:hypothetical protein
MQSSAAKKKAKSKSKKPKKKRNLNSKTLFTGNSTEGYQDTLGRLAERYSEQEDLQRKKCLRDEIKHHLNRMQSEYNVYDETGWRHYRKLNSEIDRKTKFLGLDEEPIQEIGKVERYPVNKRSLGYSYFEGKKYPYGGNYGYGEVEFKKRKRSPPQTARAKNQDVMPAGPTERSVSREKSKEVRSVTPRGVSAGFDAYPRPLNRLFDQRLLTLSHRDDYENKGKDSTKQNYDHYLYSNRNRGRCVMQASGAGGSKSHRAKTNADAYDTQPIESYLREVKKNQLTSTVDPKAKTAKVLKKPVEKNGLTTTIVTKTLAAKPKTAKPTKRASLLDANKDKPKKKWVRKPLEVDVGGWNSSTTVRLSKQQKVEVIKNKDPERFTLHRVESLRTDDPYYDPTVPHSFSKHGASDTHPVHDRSFDPEARLLNGSVSRRSKAGSRRSSMNSYSRRDSNSGMARDPLQSPSRHPGLEKSKFEEPRPQEIIPEAPEKL